MRRKPVHFLGGNTVGVQPTDAPLDEACKDPEFLEYCADIVCCVVPPKARLARMFQARGFAAPNGGWTPQNTARVFGQAFGLMCKEALGSRGRARDVRINGNKEKPPEILGVRPSGEPYAWTPGSWT